MFIRLDGLCSRSVCTSCEYPVSRLEATNITAEEKQDMSQGRAAIDNAVYNAAIQLFASVLILQSQLMYLPHLVPSRCDSLEGYEQLLECLSSMAEAFIEDAKCGSALFYYGTLVVHNESS